MVKEINVWGRVFKLHVIYDVYEDEEILDIQKEALEIFIKKADIILRSSEAIKQYCIENDGDLIEGYIEDIFQYVIPEGLFINRNLNKREVSLLCWYKFDEENGIAITFVNEQLDQICSQDML